MTPKQTLREKLSEDWKKFNGDQIGDETILDWFLAQFDAMLAEDIAEIQKTIDILPQHKSAYESGVWVALTKAKSILEAQGPRVSNRCYPCYFFKVNNC